MTACRYTRVRRVHRRRLITASIGLHEASTGTRQDHWGSRRQSRSAHMTQCLDARHTSELLPIRCLIASLREAALEYEAETISSPERLVVAMTRGTKMLSMPAVASDIAIHKLVNVSPSNAKSGLPTIHGLVVVCDPHSGEILFQVDGPTLTAKRTAAITLLAVETLTARAPESILVIGVGKQASAHVEAIAEVYPGAQIRIQGSSMEGAQRFVDKHRSGAPRLAVDSGGDDADVVVTLTTSKTPVYRDEARPNRLVVGVGSFTPDAAEIHRNVIHRSNIFVDDRRGAKHEAGDLIQAGVDWRKVRSLASAFTSRPDFSTPMLFKSVGSGAWDLAAARVIRTRLKGRTEIGFR